MAERQRISLVPRWLRVSVRRQGQGTLLSAMSTDIVIIRQMAGIKGSMVSSVMEGNARSMFVAATSSNEQDTTVSSSTDGKTGEWKFSSSYRTRDLSFGSRTSERGI